MSTRLELALYLLAGGATLLAYFGMRWWHWARQRPSRASPDVKTERVEPSITNMQALDSFPDLAPPPVQETGAPGVLHPTIDCIAQLHIDSPCSGEIVLNLLPATRRVGSKTWAIEGKNTANQQWESVVAGQTYATFQAGIQLVNRHGALNDVEFSEFVVKAGEIAEGLSATPEFPDMRSEVARARELEQFSIGHDIKLSLNLHAKRIAWSLSYVQQHAQRAGFVAGVIPGRWVLGVGSHELIALTIDTHAAMADDVSSEPIRKLVLSLSVPLVSRGNNDIGSPFDVMSDIAIRLSASMEAVILDEQGLSVDTAALERTSQELNAVYDRLDAAGLSAGSPLAKRLFS